MKISRLAGRKQPSGRGFGNPVLDQLKVKAFFSRFSS